MVSVTVDLSRTSAVTPGFRLTEDGVIPEDWSSDRLGDLVMRVGSGITPRGGERVYKPEGRPFVRSQNVGWGALIFDDIAFLDEKTHSTFASSEIEEGDVLLNITGASIGRTVVADSRVAGGNVNQHVCEIRTKRGTLDPRYLSSYLLSAKGQRQIDSFQAGGNRQGLNYSQIRSFVIPYPTLDEQIAISEALADATSEISALERLIAKKLAMMLGARQHLLTGKTRLPGFQGAWQPKTLIGLVDGRKDLFDDGDWIEAEFLTDSGVRLIQTANIGLGRFEDKTAKKYISEDAFGKLHCKALQPGDLLICRLADPAGRACLLPDLKEQRVITAVDVTICRPPGNVADRNYLSQLFSTQWWFETVSQRSGGTTRSRIARSELGRIEFQLPEIQEQRAIAAVLSDLGSEIEALALRRDKMRDVKQGMMQALLTGRVRLTQGRASG